MSATRPTEYEGSPSQTQSYGEYCLTHPIAELHDQAMKLLLAQAVENLKSGPPHSSGDKTTLIVSHELTLKNLLNVKQMGTLFPKAPALDLKQLSDLARFCQDLLDDNGNWKRQFDDKIAKLINQHVSKLTLRVKKLISEVTNTLGFDVACDALFAITASLENVGNIETAAPWQRRDAAELEDVQDTFASYDALPESKIRVFRSRFSSDEQTDIELAHQTLTEAVAKRGKQLRAEVNHRVVQRLLDANRSDSLPNLISKIQESAERLAIIAEKIRETIEPAQNTPTSICVVSDVRQELEKGGTLLDAFCSEYQQSGCSVRDIEALLRNGLQVDGRMLRPVELTAMSSDAACEAILHHGSELFCRSIENVLKVDLTHPGIQLNLINLMPELINRSEAYLQFNTFKGAVIKRENYLFCHPELRPLLEQISRGRVRFANHRNDGRFALDSKHVIRLTCSAIGPGHARHDYLAALYRRAQLMSKGGFKSLYASTSFAARPLAISQRPDSMADCRQLFDLGLEIGVIRTVKPKNAATDSSAANPSSDERFICHPLDDTIRKRFCPRRHHRRRLSAGFLRQFMEQEWFEDYVSMTIENVPADWHANLIEIIDSLEDGEIGDALVELGIFSLFEGGYIFGREFDKTMPHQEILFVESADKPVALKHGTFLNAMLRYDDLYTRILIDVVFAEAAGRLSLKRLTSFGQQLVKTLRDHA